MYMKSEKNTLTKTKRTNDFFKLRSLELFVTFFPCSIFERLIIPKIPTYRTVDAILVDGIITKNVNIRKTGLSFNLFKANIFKQKPVFISFIIQIHNYNLTPHLITYHF